MSIFRGRLIFLLSILFKKDWILFKKDWILFKKDCIFFQRFDFYSFYIISIFKIGMPILSFGHFGTEKSFTTGKAGSEGFLKFLLSHEWHIPNPVQVTLFPHDWLSRRGKKKILHDRRSHEWGKSVMCTGFGMCHEWRIGNFPSKNGQMTGLAFLFWK